MLICSSLFSCAWGRSTPTTNDGDSYSYIGGFEWYAVDRSVSSELSQKLSKAVAGACVVSLFPAYCHLTPPNTALESHLTHLHLVAYYFELAAVSAAALCANGVRGTTTG